jgi:poly(3-hydroxybutyrate) depolymerase
VLYLPRTYAAGTPSPVLVVFHGNGDTASNFFSYTQLAPVADAHNAILAFPQAIPGSGPNGADWNAYALSSNPDLTFARAVLDDVEARFLVDARRKHVVGYSQGGFMAFLWAMADSAELASVVTASSCNPLSGGTLLSGAARHIPVYMMIGTQDALLTCAQQTRQDLQSYGFPVQYEELVGAGHCCYPYGHNQQVWAFLSSNPLP